MFAYHSHAGASFRKCHLWLLFRCSAAAHNCEAVTGVIFEFVFETLFHSERPVQAIFPTNVSLVFFPLFSLIHEQKSKQKKRASYINERTYWTDRMAPNTCYPEVHHSL